MAANVGFRLHPIPNKLGSRYCVSFHCPQSCPQSALLEHGLGQLSPADGSSYFEGCWKRLTLSFVIKVLPVSTNSGYGEVTSVA